MTASPPGKPSASDSSVQPTSAAWLWGLGLAAAAIWLVDLALLRGGTPHPWDDTWEYGLVAKSLLAGHGFRTPMIHPPLWTLRDASLTVPVLVHGPLLPLLLAPLVGWLGPAALSGTAWLAAVCVTLAAVFTARAVARAAGRRSGIAAGALVTLAPALLRLVHHDVAPAAGALAVAVTIDLICRDHPRPLAAGVALGIGALVRPELLLAAPIAAFVVGKQRALPLVLACAAVIAPWALHTFAATGSPLFNLSSYLVIGFTKSHPGLSPLMDFGIPPSRWPVALGQALPELPDKWLHMAPRAVKHLLMQPGPGLGAVAALGATAAAGSAATRRWAWAALAAAAIPLVVVTLTESSERYAGVWVPLLAAGAVRGVTTLARGAAARRLALAALVLVVVPFTARAFSDEAHRSAELDRWIRHERTALAAMATPAAPASPGATPRPLFSDTPDFAAWLTGRPTVWVTREQYLTLPDHVARDAVTPARGDPGDEWFHSSVLSLSPGGAATPIEAPAR